MSSTDCFDPRPSRETRSNGGVRPCSGGHWSVANIAAMVLGFVFFAPLGFAILVWTLMGRPVQELPAWAREKWSRFVVGNRTSTYSESENTVFNEYQQAQYDRIRELKDEIKKRTEAFRRFRFDAKRRKDQQEFDDFMASKPEAGYDEV
jgi:hypothetical protein